MSVGMGEGMRERPLSSRRLRPTLAGPILILSFAEPERRIPLSLSPVTFAHPAQIPAHVHTYSLPGLVDSSSAWWQDPCCSNGNGNGVQFFFFSLCLSFQ